MNERITLICTFDDNNNEKIKSIISQIDNNLCKVPFGKNVPDRIKADTLPYHFTLIYWKNENEDFITKELMKINFPKIKVHIDNIEIKKAAEESYELFFHIKDDTKLRLLQQVLYENIPSKIYTPGSRSFHISIHADQDYEKIHLMKQKLMKTFKPFELEVENISLYTIYPAKLINNIKL